MNNITSLLYISQVFSQVDKVWTKINTKTPVFTTLYAVSLLFIGLFLLFPQITNAKDLIHHHILTADLPISPTTAQQGQNVNGPDIFNVTNSIQVEGDYRAYANEIDCSDRSDPDPFLWTNESYWQDGELDSVTIESKIDSGPWQPVGFLPATNRPDPTFTGPSTCQDEDTFKNETGTFSQNVDTSFLPQDSSTHTLVLRSTSAPSSAQQVNTITYIFTMDGSSSPAPTVNLTANPTSVSSGDSSTLTWTPSNATSCDASGDWSGNKNKNGGSQVVNNLTSSKSYTITCTNSAGSASDTATVSVGGGPPPPSAPSVNLTANPTSVSSGGASTLSWTVSNATSCDASGDWSGSKNSGGGSESTGSLTSSKSYTLTCTGSGGSDSDTASVSVGGGGGDDIIVTLSASPSCVAPGGNTTLTWITTDTTSNTTCSASVDWDGNKNRSGGSEVRDALNSNKTYTITCDDPSNGTDSETTHVTVGTCGALSDLIISVGPTRTPSGTILPGDEVVFKSTTKNEGSVETGGGFQIQHLVDGGATFNDTKPSNGLPVNGTRVKNSRPWIATEGTHTYSACADSDNEVQESNESNNCSSGGSFVVVSPVSPDDDANPFDINIPTSFTPGETKAISFSVDNTGNTYWYDGTAYQFRRTDESSFILDCDVGGEYAHLPFVVHSVSSSHDQTSFPSSCDLTAPSTPGDYTFSMQMRHRSGWDWLLEPDHDNAGTAVGTFFFGNELSRTISVADDPAGDIVVNATLDGNPWSGSVDYDILGPSTIGGSSVPITYSNENTGVWTFSYTSGGPSNSSLSSIEVASSQTLTDGGTVTYTLVFGTLLSDLDITVGPTVSTSPITEGDIVTFSATTKNIGVGSTISGFSVQFKMDASPFSTIATGALGVGSSAGIVSGSWTAVAGPHSVQVCADSGSAISESNESNNCDSAIVSVDSPPPKQCEDGIDNDGDGWVDEADPDCHSGPGGTGPYDPDDDDESGGTDKECSDGIDNDEDGVIDGNDPDCSDAYDDKESPVSFIEF